jgi:DHA2 family lincomycin resistance protein-like MFS transporter
MLSPNTTILATPITSARRDRAIIMTLLVATFVVILNETIMNVALPRLMTDLKVSASTVQWLTTAFLLVMAVVIPTTGFLIQRFSTRTLFMAAMGVFSLGTLIAAGAPNFAVLLGSRILQAMGTALMLPLLMTTILGLIPIERRGAMMGTVSIVISVAPAIGPTISGLILQSLSWRFMFLFMVPIVLVVLVYGARNLVNVGELETAQIDTLSVILAALGFGGVVYGFSVVGEGGWASANVLGALAIGAVGLIWFTLRQLRLTIPLLNLRAFRYPLFTLSVVIMMAVMASLFASAILLPIYLQTIRHFKPLMTGLLLLPGGALMGVAGPVVGRIFDRSGPRALVLVGSTTVCITHWQFAGLTAATPVPVILVLHAAFSLGLSMLFTPVMTTGLNQLPPFLHSHGSAISTTLHQVAGAVGTALLISVMTTQTKAALGPAGATASAGVQEAALLTGIQSAFAVAAGIAVLALVLGLFLRRAQPSEDTAATHSTTMAH